MAEAETISARAARRLREARYQKGLTVREAATLMGFTEHSMLVRYENGEARPSWERLAHMAKVYGLTLAALLAQQDEAVGLIAGIDQTDSETVQHIRAALEAIAGGDVRGP